MNKPFKLIEDDEGTIPIYNFNVFNCSTLRSN